jgi:hypothetical protein
MTVDARRTALLLIADHQGLPFGAISRSRRAGLLWIGSCGNKIQRQVRPNGDPRGWSSETGSASVRVEDGMVLATNG